jgi:DNA polymerase III subunit alpha
LQFNSFQLLHDIMDAYAKKLSIQLNIKELSEEKVKNIKNLLVMHPGNHNLKFVIYDDEEELKLEMNSRLQKIKISQELLEELKEQEVFYKLN